jgi:hypothetical protein
MAGYSVIVNFSAIVFSESIFRNDFPAGKFYAAYLYHHTRNLLNKAATWLSRRC